MSEALSHLRVVELCDDVPGAFCGRQFAAWGARVVALEGLDGSPLRAAPPLLTAADGATVSCLWEFISAGKQIVQLDPGTAVGRENMAGLLSDADIFVTDLPAGRLEKALAETRSLRDAYPRLIIVSISSFGEDGPYAGYQATDLIVQALSGFMGVNGLPEREPLKAPANIVPYACGLQAFIAALAALWERRSSGRGQGIEVACLEATASLVPFLRTQYTGRPAARQGGSYSGTRLYPCSDGWIAFSPHTERGWESLMIAFDLDDPDVPELLRAPEGRRDWEAVRGFVAEETARFDADDLFHRLNELGIPTGLSRTPGELLSDPHLRARSFFQQPQPSAAGPLTFPGRAAMIAASPPGPASGRDSVAGDHKGSRPPLAGVRILDLTQAWIGPYATMLLADLGADVIKVESHRRPDVWRGGEEGGALRPLGARPDAHPWNINFNFNSVNRNKRGLTLDLNRDEGKALFRRLVEGADLVVENFTPRVMENFGLGYGALAKLTPDLVMVSFSGYGDSGPYRDYKANGATTEAVAGWDALLGYSGGPPLMLGAMEADPLCGLQIAALALVGLHRRGWTGRGARIEGSMFEGAAGYIAELIAHASAGGEAPIRQGNRHPSMAPHCVLRCRGEDEWIAIAVRDDRDWQALRSVAGEGSGLDDARFDTAAGRLAAVEEVEHRLGHWVRQHPARDLMHRLQRAGVPAAPVLRTDQVFTDEQFVARGWFIPMTHPDAGAHLHNGFAWRFARSPLVCRTPSPRLGEDSAEVLSSVLGVSAGDYQRLVHAGVTGSVQLSTDGAGLPPA